jgi:hypothetical protein
MGMGNKLAPESLEQCRGSLFPGGEEFVIAVFNFELE